MSSPDTICLAHFTTPSLLIPELRSGDAQAVVAELCSALERHGQVTEVLPFYTAVLAREHLCSTVVAPGIALPHARLPGLPELCFAVGRTRQPLAWFAGNQPAVRLVLLFAVPEAEAATYLSLMSGVARLSRDRARMAQLLEANEPGDMFQVLEQIPLRQPRLAALRV